jgi:hypothetical protein
VGTLVLAGEIPLRPAGEISRGRCEPTQLRNLYTGSDVLVIPSVPTRDFLEPWGLVANEAFHPGVPVIATRSWSRGRRPRTARTHRFDRPGGRRERAPRGARTPA